VVNIGTIPSLLKYKQYRNSQFGFVTGALAAAFILRRWRLLAVLSALEVVNFIGYPSASSLLCLAVMVGTLYMTGARSPKLRASWLVAAASVMVLMSLFNFQATLGLLSDYFSAVGKYDATAGRLALWQTGLQQFHGSPLLGHAFAGSTVASAVRTTGSAVQHTYHNDLVLFLVEGGIVGLGLFLLWAASTEMLLLRRFTGFRDAGRTNPANLVRVFLVMFNTFLVGSAFNPTFNPVSPAATLYTLYGVVMLLGAPEDLAPSRRGP
jgi:O-antigen ligase